SSAPPAAASASRPWSPARFARHARQPWLRIAAPVAALVTMGALVLAATGAKHDAPAPSPVASAAPAASAEALVAVPPAPLAQEPQAAESDTVDPDIVLELDDAPNDPTLAH